MEADIQHWVAEVSGKTILICMVIWHAAVRITYLMTGFHSLLALLSWFAFIFAGSSLCLTPFQMIYSAVYQFCNMIQEQKQPENKPGSSHHLYSSKKSRNGTSEQCWSLQDRLPLIPGAAAPDPLPHNRYLFQKHLLIEAGAVKSLGEHSIRPEIWEEKSGNENILELKKNSMYLLGELTVYIRLT